jgi:LPXTG-motif cell wall-anchored protein
MGIVMSERKFLVNRVRIGLVGLVVLALTGVSAGGAGAATGRGTAAASITLLDVSLGGVQNLKVLSDEGQGTLDPTRFNLAGPRAFGQLTAVNASGIVNLVLPNPPARAEAPGTAAASPIPTSIPVSFPPSSLPGVGAVPVDIGVLASGTINPVKIEAFVDAAGARSAVGTEVPSLSVLSGLIGVNNVKVGDVASAATPTASTSNSGVLSIGEITVLDLSQLLGMANLGLADLPLSTLTGLVDSLGLGVPTGSLGLGTITGADADNLLSTLGGLGSVLGVLQTIPVGDCSALNSAVAPLSGLPLDAVLGSGGLLGSLGLGSILNLTGLLSSCNTAGVINTVTGTIQGLLPALDGVFSVLEGAPLIKLSGVELSALAHAADTLAGSKAETTAKFGTLTVGGMNLGVLDVNSTVEQVIALKNTVESTLDSVTGTLGLGNLIDVAIMERTASTKTEGVYNVADAGINVLRVSINPPAALSSILGTLSSSPVSSVLGAVQGLNLPADTGLATGVLSQAMGLTTLLSQPTSITVGAIRAQSDFTTAAAGTTTGAPGGPVSPPVSGELPRTGTSNGAWMAALAAIALAGAFGITRSLRKAPIEA